MTPPPCATTPQPFRHAETAIMRARQAGPSGYRSNLRALEAAAPALHICHTCPMLATCQPIDDYTGVVAGRAWDKGTVIRLPRQRVA